jgi:hypothetical protein
MEVIFKIPTKLKILILLIFVFMLIVPSLFSQGFTVEKANEIKTILLRCEFINIHSRDYSEANNYLNDAIRQKNAGNIRQSNILAERAVSGYRQNIIYKLKEGVIENLLAEIEKSKRFIPPAKYSEAKNKLKSLSNYLDMQLRLSYDIPVVIQKTKYSIDYIKGLIYPVFYINPPDTLILNKFKLVIDSYDGKIDYDFEKKVITNASGTAWLSFSDFLNVSTASTKTGQNEQKKSFKVVNRVNNLLTEISLTDAKLVNPRLRPGDSCQIVLNANTSTPAEMITAKAKFIGALRLRKGDIKVVFNNLTIQQGENLHHGKVLQGSVTYPSNPLEPEKMIVDIFGFKLFIDSLVVDPNAANANAVLELIPTLLASDHQGPGDIQLGTITIDPSCQFVKELPENSYGSWILANYGIKIRGKGMTIDFSSTSGWGRDRPKWPQVTLINGSTVPHDKQDTSNIGYLYGRYHFGNAIISPRGITTELLSNGRTSYITLIPFGYTMNIHNSRLQIRNDSIISGKMVASCLLPASVSGINKDTILVQLPDLKVDRLLNITGKQFDFQGTIQLSETTRNNNYYTIFPKSAFLYLPAEPALEIYSKLKQSFFDKTHTDRSYTRTEVDKKALPGMTINSFDTLVMHSPDVSSPIYLNEPKGWLNIDYQGAIGGIYKLITLSPETLKEPCIKDSLGRTSATKYWGGIAFNNKFCDSISLDFVHNAVYNSSFQGEISLPPPIGAIIPYSNMGFTSTASCIGGNPVF